MFSSALRSLEPSLHPPALPTPANGCKQEDHYDGILAQTLMEGGWRGMQYEGLCAFSHAPNPQVRRLLPGLLLALRPSCL